MAFIKEEFYFEKAKPQVAKLMILFLAIYPFHRETNYKVEWFAGAVNMVPGIRVTPLPTQQK